MNFSDIKIKSPIFISSFLLFVIVVTVAFVVPKTSWKNIFNVNKFATVLFTTDDGLYNTAVANNWSAYGSAWGESTGWLTFSPNTSSKVYIADDALSGYLYGENIGWVSLSCRNTDTCNSVSYGVSNDTEGNLSGYAWGENIGWVDFGTSTGAYQVKISATGTFSGYAYGENVGFVNFGVGLSSATSTWTPSSLRPVGTKKAQELRQEEEETREASSTEEMENEATEAAKAAGTSTPKTPEEENTETKLQEIGLEPIKPVSLPVNIPQVLTLKELPSFGGENGSKISFSFVPAVSTFLFSPLPQTTLLALNKTPELKKYLSTVGISGEQNLVSISLNPIPLPKASEFNIPNLFTVNQGTSTLRNFVTSDSNYQLLQLVRVASGTPIIVSFIPAKASDSLAGEWNNEAITFMMDQNRAVIGFMAPGTPGRYILTASASSMSLVVEVVKNTITQPVVTDVIPTWLSRVLGWFGR